MQTIHSYVSIATDTSLGKQSLTIKRIACKDEFRFSE
jgi:hypothetical protein